MGISKAGKANGMIQFASYSRELPSLIDQDVYASPFKTKTQYFNALSSRLVALDPQLQNSSQIEELLLRLDLIDNFPFEQIRAIASNENRHCDQMLMHIVQEYLARYEKSRKRKASKAGTTSNNRST